MGLENIVISERSQSPKATHCWLRFQETSRSGRPERQEGRLVVARSWERGEGVDSWRVRYAVSSFKKYFYYAFVISGWTASSLLCMGFLWLWSAGASLARGSHCRARRSHCRSLSCCREQALGHSSFSIRGASAEVLYGLWNLPGPGIEPVSSTL